MKKLLSTLAMAMLSLTALPSCGEKDNNEPSVVKPANYLDGKTFEWKKVYGSNGSRTYTLSFSSKTFVLENVEIEGDDHTVVTTTGTYTYDKQTKLVKLIVEKSEGKIIKGTGASLHDKDHRGQEIPILVDEAQNALTAVGHQEDGVTMVLTLKK